MAVALTNRIFAGLPALNTVPTKDDDKSPNESSAIVPISSPDAYPDAFPAVAGYSIEHAEDENPIMPETYSPAGADWGAGLPPLEGEYAGVGIDSFVRVVPDVGGREGLRDNLPYTRGPVAGGGVSMGQSWMDGRTLRIRRKAEASRGPVGYNDYASSLQYSLAMSEVEMAMDAASRATIAVSL